MKPSQMPPSDAVLTQAAQLQVWRAISLYPFLPLTWRMAPQLQPWKHTHQSSTERLLVLFLLFKKETGMMFITSK